MNTHADLIEQYAQDWKETDEPWKRWEQSNGDGRWAPCRKHPLWHQLVFYRRKPRTFMVGDVEVSPVQEAPKEGQRYYTACPVMSDYFLEGNWLGWGTQHNRLKRGLIHLNKEDAIAHGKALAALTGGE